MIDFGRRGVQIFSLSRLCSLAPHCKEVLFQLPMKPASWSSWSEVRKDRMDAFHLSFIGNKWTCSGCTYEDNEVNVRRAPLALPATLFSHALTPPPITPDLACPCRIRRAECAL